MKLEALKCDACSFTTSSKTNLNMDQWATIHFMVKFKSLTHNQIRVEKKWKKTRAKIIDSLGGKMHICPGCIIKFEGGNINLRMISQ